MIPVKTNAGQQVLKDRSVVLTQRQRTALIVIDGRRGMAEVMQSSGAGPEDITLLFQLGLAADLAVGTAATEPAPLLPMRNRPAAA
jgi:hypothetical protein